MNTVIPIESFKHVKKLALCDEVLNRSLRSWHRMKGINPHDWYGLDFDVWFDRLIVHVATQIMTLCDATRPVPSDDDIVEGIRIQAIGDVFALSEEKTARKCFETDTNCYIEEGVVFSSIWLRGADEKAVECEADRIADDMNNLGYSAEVWIDEEDAHEATVNTQIDFPLYVEMVRRKENPTCTLCKSKESGKVIANEEKGKVWSQKQALRIA